MKDSKREKRHNGRERPDGDEALTELMAGYTPRQRETFRKGVRIWAKVAIRSYMRKREAEFPTENRGEEEGE